MRFQIGLVLFLQIINLTFGDDFTFATYFQDNMVLQQEPSMAVVWGYGTVGADVSVSLDKDTLATEVVNGADGKGTWAVVLSPQPADGTARLLNATQNNNGVVTNIMLKNILFGEVWVCSGQSNMQFTTSMVFNASDELAATTKYPNIRIFTVAEHTSTVPLYDLANIEQNWSIPSKETVGGAAWSYFSAVCWLYGRYLYDHLKIPVGLIATTWGGTPVESWSSPTALDSCGLNQYDEEYYERIKHIKTPSDNSVLWNAMIHPLLNLTIKGAIWYQGEANAIYHSDKYSCSFPAMINNWRKNWYMSHQQTDPQFPFGFVQLSTVIGTNYGPFANIRWHQTADYGYVPNKLMPNTFMSVAMDLPDDESPYSSVHPRDKQDVGARLVLGSLKQAYGMHYNPDGPIISSAVRTGDGHIVVTYPNDQQLVVKEAGNFKICCDSVKCDPLAPEPSPDWLWAPILSYTHRTITLDAKSCSTLKATPKLLRYAWGQRPCNFKSCSVYNVMGLPAPPYVIEINDL